MKIIAITQARSGSTRLPEKILKRINGKTMLQIHIERILKSNLIDDLCIATTTKPEDDKIEILSKELGVKCFRGNENDVLDRFYQAVKNTNYDFIVRLTSDCPLIDPKLIDEVIETGTNGDYDYFSNTLKEEFPDGQDIELISFKALETAWKNAKKTSEREHVTPYIRLNGSYDKGKIFKSGNLHSSNINYKSTRLTVDEDCDFKTIKNLILELGEDKTWLEYSKYLNEHPNLELNNHVKRNEGYLKSLNNDI